MSLNIAEFVKKLVPSLSRSDTEADLNISMESIDVIVTSATQMGENDKVAKLASKEAQEIVKSFYHELDKAGKLHIKLSKQIHVDLVTLFKNVQQNGEYLRKQLEDISNEVIVTHAMNTIKANVIRAVGHYFFMTRFALDLINYIYLFEAQKAGIEFMTEAQLKKSQIQFIEKNLWIFVLLLSVYGDKPDVLRDRMGELSETLLPKDAMDEVMSVYDIQKLDVLSNLPAGFIGSPIYSIRLVFTQWEADRYRHLKDKKRLLELRLLHLRMLKENGQSDIQMEKEMTHLQKSVTDLDYKISKIEEDINA